MYKVISLRVNRSEYDYRNQKVIFGRRIANYTEVLVCCKSDLYAELSHPYRLSFIDIFHQPDAFHGPFPTRCNAPSFDAHAYCRLT